MLNILVLVHDGGSSVGGVEQPLGMGDELLLGGAGFRRVQRRRLPVPGRPVLRPLLAVRGGGICKHVKPAN